MSNVHRAAAEPRETLTINVQGLSQASHRAFKARCAQLGVTQREAIEALFEMLAHNMLDVNRFASLVALGRRRRVEA